MSTGIFFLIMVLKYYFFFRKRLPEIKEKRKIQKYIKKKRNRGQNFENDSYKGRRGTKLKKTEIIDQLIALGHVSTPKLKTLTRPILLARLDQMTEVLHGLKAVVVIPSLNLSDFAVELEDEENE